MKTRASVFLLIVITIVTSSCIPPQGVTTQKRPWGLNTDRDTAWDAVVKAIAARGLIFNVIEKDSGVITTESHTFSDQEYFECDSWMNVNPFTVEARFSFIMQTVNPKLNELSITTTSSVLRESFEVTYTRRIWSPCMTTWKFEQELVDSIFVNIHGQL